MSGVSVKSPKRAMPEIDPNKRRRIFERIGTIREAIVDTHHQDILIVDLARAIAEGDRPRIIEILRSNNKTKAELFKKDGGIKKVTINLLKMLHEIYMETISRINFRLEEAQTLDEYEKKKNEKFREYESSIVGRAFISYEIIRGALNILPQVLSGKIRANPFSSRIGWIGGNEEAEKPGRIVLALSGGSAKGIFYLGFIQALREEEFWPDLVVGTSAGAIAGAALASGKKSEEIEELFSIKKLRSMFNPLMGLITFILSKGAGVIGFGFGRYLKNIFGEAKMSDTADLFVVTSVHSPTNFGKTVVGQASPLNREVSLSSDIPVWQAVWGSSSIQGVIPPPTISPFSAERLSGRGLGLKTSSLNLPFATLEDGGVTEYLPVLTAEHLLEKMGKTGLIIGVNLANLNPMNTSGYEYLSLRDRIETEMDNFEERGLVKYPTPRIWFRAIKGWIKQEMERLFNRLAPMRAYKALETFEAQNVAQTVALVEGRGFKILLNPNSDGTLDHIKLGAFRGAEESREYGYEVGKNLIRILLGNGLVTEG
ncbi:MAG TPA: patatin-like phospholipase family protein [Candidatus Bilamarchaeaceae archaeon]|nr:patatin-like phospholipase family protein [Candidatus Bilamarchaeaceae archaeon]